MRKFPIVLLLVAIGAPSIAVVSNVVPVAYADDPTADEIAVRVQKFYDASKTFKATFKQTYTIKVQNVQKVSTGKVTFEKPGKMNWLYDAPNGNRVVSDGVTIRVYEKENDQMFEMMVAKSQYPAALSFLMGNGQLTRDFTLRLVPEIPFEAGYVIEGTPKDGTPAYQKVLLFVDQATSQVRRVLILDAQGNKNRFDFEAPVVNERVPPTEFVFNPPPTTKIIRP
jgi:outer membrane lipoprotein carrier protein